MSDSHFNEAQLAKLEEQFQFARMHGDPRPPARRSYMISLMVSELGPEVTSQNVGSWFAKRAKREAGQPRMTRKTPEQLAILEDSFARYAYPGNEELIRLIRTTLLSKRQIDAWFCHQRKKFPELIEAREIQKHISAQEETAALQPGEKPKGLNTHPLEKMWKEVEAERQQTLAALAQSSHSES